MMLIQQKNQLSKDDPVLEARNVYFKYKRNNPIIKGMNLTIKPGEIVGISGENGSGKSTLLKLLVGLLNSQRGEMIKNGRIGYSPQELLLFENLTVSENFRVFGKGLGLSQAEIKQGSTGIMNRLRFHNYRDTLVKNLSGGTAQKLNFELSLLGSPDILILDEPYQGMDYASYQAFWEIQNEMRNKGKAILIVSHLIEDKSKFSRTIHLINGKLQGCTLKDCPECCGETT